MGRKQVRHETKPSWTPGQCRDVPPIIDIHYFAGLVDGEGSIMLIAEGSKYKHPEISLTSTDKELIDWVIAVFGGKAYVNIPKVAHHKQAWHWRVRNLNHVMFILELIAPHLKIDRKRGRANLILRSYKKVTLRNGKYNPEQLKSKLAFEEEFSNIV